MARQHQFVARRICFNDEYGIGNSHVWTCSRCGGSPHYFECSTPETEHQMSPVLPDCDDQLVLGILSS